MILQDAIAVALRQHGLHFVSLRRETKFHIYLTFERPATYWTIDVEVKPEGAWTAETLAAALYRLAVDRIGAWVGSPK